jgi:hypothetical protein
MKTKAVSFLAAALLMIAAGPSVVADGAQTTGSGSWCSPAQNGNGNTVVCNGVDQALRAPRLVEAREGDRLAAGVDAVHQIFVGRQLRLTTQQHQRLNPRARSGRSSLANLHVVPIASACILNAVPPPQPYRRDNPFDLGSR